MGNETCLNFDMNKDKDNDLFTSQLMNRHAPDPQFAHQIQDSATELNCNVNHIRQLFINEKLEPYVGYEPAPFKKDAFYQIYQYHIYYNGQWKNGVPHGEGQAILKDGSYFKGFFQQGVGKGKKCLFVLKNGAYYLGSIQRNKRVGRGLLKDKQYTYTGEWLNNIPQGQGYESFKNGDKFEGRFVKGKRCGEGRYLWKAGQFVEYKGFFNENNMQGDGVLSMRNGTIIKGIFSCTEQFNIEQCSIKTENYSFTGSLLDGQPSSMCDLQTKQREMKYVLKRGEDNKSTGKMIDTSQNQFRIYKNKILIYYDETIPEKKMDAIIGQIENGYKHAKKHSLALQSIRNSLKEYKCEWWEKGNPKQGIAIVEICGKCISVDKIK